MAPLTWLIRCQVEPAFRPAHSVRQLEPGTVAATVSFARGREPGLDRRARRGARAEVHAGAGRDHGLRCRADRRRHGGQADEQERGERDRERGRGRAPLGEARTGIGHDVLHRRRPAWSSGRPAPTTQRDHPGPAERTTRDMKRPAGPARRTSSPGPLAAGPDRVRWRRGPAGRVAISERLRLMQLPLALVGRVLRVALRLGLDLLEDLEPLRGIEEHGVARSCRPP